MPHRPAKELADEARRGDLSLLPGHLHDGRVWRRCWRKPPPMKSKPVKETMSWFALLGANLPPRPAWTTLSVALERRAVGQETRRRCRNPDPRRGRGLPGVGPPQHDGDGDHAGEQHDTDDPAADHPTARRRSNVCVIRANQPLNQVKKRPGGRMGRASSINTPQRPATNVSRDESGDDDRDRDRPRRNCR